MRFALGYVCACVYVCVCAYSMCVCEEAMSHRGRPLGPVTAGVLFVSCGPLLTQTALLWEASCCDSLLTHARTHTHTKYTSLRPSWPCPWALSNQATAGVTCPSQKGKVAIFDISIKLPHEEEDGGECGGDRESGVSLCLFFFCPPLSLSLFLALLCGKYCSDSVREVKISLASSEYLNPAAWMKNTEKCIVLMGAFH